MADGRIKPRKLSNLPKVTELVGVRARFVPGGLVAKSATLVFCQGCWAGEL